MVQSAASIVQWAASYASPLANGTQRAIRIRSRAALAQRNRVAHAVRVELCGVDVPDGRAKASRLKRLPQRQGQR